MNAFITNNLNITDYSIDEVGAFEDEKLVVLNAEREENFHEEFSLKQADHAEQVMGVRAALIAEDDHFEQIQAVGDIASPVGDLRDFACLLEE